MPATSHGRRGRRTLGRRRQVPAHRPIQVFVDLRLLFPLIDSGNLSFAPFLNRDPLARAVEHFYVPHDVVCA